MEIQTITTQLVDDFARYLALDEKSRATQEKYLRDLRCYVVWLDGREPDRALNLRYKQHLQEHYCLSSANSMLAALNSFFRFAGWEELYLRQFRVQKKAYCPAEMELSREEYSRLINAAREKGDCRLELILQTICATGIRVSELRFITLEAARRGEAVVTCKSKTRSVFLVAELCKRLLRYAAKQGIHGGSIFVTRSGRPVDRSNIWRQMKQLCQRCRVAPEKVFPHNLRHLFARTFYAVEKDIAKLADILGHANINTTRIYMISTGQEHRQRMEKLQLIL